MSKKKIINKKLRKGRFYLVHDGSKSGHPGMIYWKNDNKNLYLALTTETTYNKNLIKLHHKVSPNVKVSFVNKRPFLGKRKNFGDKSLIAIRFHKNDKKRVLRAISKKEPRYSTDITRKDKRYFKKRNKRKIIKY